MNKKIKKIAAVVLTLLLFFTTVPGQIFPAYAATGKITFSDPSVTVGNQVSVTMKIAAAEGALGASDVRLQYDSSALEFVSGTNANGGAGSIRVVGSMESENQTTFSFTLKFKALKAGTTSVKVTSQEVYDADSQVVTIDHVGSSAVKVEAPVTYSKDTSLSNLTIAPGTLDPEFQPDVTEYRAVVGSDVESLTVSAPANDGKATVSVSGNEALQLGENTITCKVTAEDGTTTKTYTILVQKTEEMPTESSENPTSADENRTPMNVEEGNWQVSESFEAANLPEGFTTTDYTYDGRNIQAGIDAQGNILFYMTNEEGEGDFFLYDAETGILAPYVTVRMAEKQIIVLPPEEIPEDVMLPDGFAECTIDIGNHTVHGWIWSANADETPEYCVVYGQNENGERNFYRYDQKEMTMQRYFKDPEGADLKTKYQEITEIYKDLLSDYKMRGWIIAGLAGACIVLLVVIVVLIMKKPKRKAIEEREEEEDFIPTQRRRKVSEEKELVHSFEKEDEIEEDQEEDDFVILDPDQEEEALEPEQKTDTEEDDELEIIDLDL